VSRRSRIGTARVALAAGLVAAALGAVGAGSAAARARWDTQVFALIPRPGFPALAYVAPNGRVYEGTYDNPTGDPLPSRVLEYTGEGTLLRSWTITGQTLTTDHGVQVTTSDALGRLLLLDRTPGRALLLDPRTGTQETYATFADLPTCAPGATGPDCSPALRDEPPFPDYGAWGPDGSLYVTDYDQAVIWRVPPGGGKAKVWLADHRLDGDMFGTAGIVLTPDHRTLLFTQASSAGLGEPNPTTGKLYSVPIQPDGKPGPLRQLWESGPTDAPDGFSLAKSGRIYVALAGPASQIAVLAPDGGEIERFPPQPLTGDNGSPVPFDTPSSTMFLGTRLMVANQSFITGTAANQAILDVETGEPGEPEFIPANAGLRPGERVGAAGAKGAKRRHRKARKRPAHHRRHRHH